MIWLTQKQVKAASKSKRTAIACSTKHWKQNWQATEEEMRKHKTRSISIGEVACSLCARYKCGRCRRKEKYWCPLKNPNSLMTCCKEYNATEIAFARWDNGIGRYSTFTAKAKIMYEKLKSLR